MKELKLPGDRVNHCARVAVGSFVVSVASAFGAGLLHSGPEHVAGLLTSVAALGPMWGAGWRVARINAEVDAGRRSGGRNIVA